ncbi:MAG: hypothetical protein AB1486_05495 [Planctomycetota bacterium]
MRVEEALEGCRLLARGGLLVGPSSGACVQAARRLALRERYACIVTILADSGERYGSTGLWAHLAA